MSRRDPAGAGGLKRRPGLAKQVRMSSRDPHAPTDFTLNWRCGFEVELLAPPGRTRADLAELLATAHGGIVRRVLHADSEPSLVAGKPVFQNLTLGFEALDATGGLVVRCVDDLTLQHDLDRQAAPRAGWWRVVSDDERLIRILARYLDAAAELPAALDALPAALGVSIDAHEGGVFRILDSARAPLGLAAPLPGERERPCELVTPPIEAAHGARLETLLAAARHLGFKRPLEGATHVHFDAAALCDARVLANLVALLTHRALQLRVLCGTPPTFRRVGGLSPAVLHCIFAPDFAELPWATARARVAAAEPSKYCDYNLKNLAHARADRHTFEVRIFPTYLDAAPIVAAAGLFEGLLRRCLDGPPVRVRMPAPFSLRSALRLLDELPLAPDLRAHWRAEARRVEALRTAT